MATSKKNVSMTKEDKDPRGGLTAKGRAKAHEAGLNLKPGVRKAEKDMTPEDMQRKGSFLRRHYANPKGALQDNDGKPTRHALQASAWGERVPKTDEDVRKLADKVAKLLDKAKTAKVSLTSKEATKSAAKKSTAKKTVTKQSVTNKVAAKKSIADKSASTAPKSKGGENH